MLLRLYHIKAIQTVKGYKKAGGGKWFCGNRDVIENSIDFHILINIPQHHS